MRAEVPLLMFLDLKLPGINGHDVIRQVRRQPAFEAMEIVLLSGSLLYADMRLAASLGANHYFEKFPSADLIRRWIDTAVKSRLDRRERREVNERQSAP
jgi:CheY-like chemotaxis protein